MNCTMKEMVPKIYISKIKTNIFISLFSVEYFLCEDNIFNTNRKKSLKINIIK